jgi:hypothetical protein
LRDELWFGPVEVRPAQRQVCVDGQAVDRRACLRRAAALIERRDRVVTKTELLDLAWPGLVVEENNLSVQISALRKALGCAGHCHRHRPGLPLHAGRPKVTRRRRPGRPAPTSQRRLATLVLRRAGLLAAAASRARPHAAIASWRLLRKCAAREARVPAAGGRIVELAAERMLFEFNSPVEALRWAIDVRQRWHDAAC